MKQAINQRPSVERGSTEAGRPNVPLKVLYLITKATSGGAQKYVYDLATNLRTGRKENLPMNSGRRTLLQSNFLLSAAISRYSRTS